MQLTFFPERLTPPQKGRFFLGDIELVAGANDVDEAIAQHRKFDFLVEQQVIVVTTPAPKPERKTAAKKEAEA